MFSSIKSKVVAAVGAASLFASNAMAATPSWWPSSVDSSAFDDILSTAAPIAIAVVVGVAGVRVVIKLINRGAGK